MQTITLTLHPYMTTGGDPVQHEAPCYVVGDLAIHRCYSVWKGEVSQSKEWTVSHLPTRMSVYCSIPARFWDRGAMIARKRDLVAWATAWQAACPEFFDAARVNDEATMRRLAPLARQKAEEC